MEHEGATLSLIARQAKGSNGGKVRVGPELRSEKVNKCRTKPSKPFTIPGFIHGEHNLIWLS